MNLTFPACSATQALVLDKNALIDLRSHYFSTLSQQLDFSSLIESSADL